MDRGQAPMGLAWCDLPVWQQTIDNHSLHKVFQAFVYQLWSDFCLDHNPSYVWQPSSVRKSPLSSIYFTVTILSLITWSIETALCCQCLFLKQVNMAFLY